MSDNINDANDLSNIDLSNETTTGSNAKINLIECKDDEISRSIFGVLELPELD